MSSTPITLQLFESALIWTLESENTRLTARVARLEGALIGVLWMAEEWFKHGGDETTFADDYEAKLEAARAVITKGEREAEPTVYGGAHLRRPWP